MKMHILLLCIATGFLSACGPAASPEIFSRRVMETLEFTDEVTVRNDWRGQSFITDDGRHALVVTGLPGSQVSYEEIFKQEGRPDPRVARFVWAEGWQAQATCRNLSPQVFQRVCWWLASAGDWDLMREEFTHWDDGWVQAILREENPVVRHNEIHEVWVVDTIFDLEGVERDRIYFPQVGCMCALPPLTINFYPEHRGRATGTLRVRVYDAATRRFKAEKTIVHEKRKKRIHGFWSNILGHLTLGAFNLPPRATFLWFSLYDTDTTGVLEDVHDTLDGSSTVRAGVADLVAGLENSSALPLGDHPASLRVQAGRGHIDVSGVLTVPVTIRNLGNGAARNARLVVASEDPQATGAIPSALELGDLTPGQVIETEVRFKIPGNLNGAVLTLTLQAQDDKVKDHRKIQVRIPLR